MPSLPSTGTSEASGTLQWTTPRPAFLPSDIDISESGAAGIVALAVAALSCIRRQVAWQYDVPETSAPPNLAKGIPHHESSTRNQNIFVGRRACCGGDRLN